MNSSFCAHQQGHLNGDHAPHPMEPRWRTPAALLLLALRSPQRRHLAGRSQARGLPSSRCPGVRRQTWSRSARLAGRSQARGLPSSRCPGVRRHTWSRSARLAGRSQARGLPSSRCPSVRGHTWSRSAQPCRRTPSQPTRARPTAVSRIMATICGWFRRPASIASLCNTRRHRVACVGSTIRWAWICWTATRISRNPLQARQTVSVATLPSSRLIR